MRSVTRSVGSLDDRNKLYALKMANIPSVNSLHSCYMVLERPWMMSELKFVCLFRPIILTWRARRKLQQRLGKDQFPLIDINFYSSSKNMAIAPPMPCVVKIGPYHS